MAYPTSTKQRQSRMGRIQRKILILLIGGLALGMAGSPRVYFKILRAIRREWKDVNKRQVQRSLRALEQRGYVRTVGADRQRRLTLTSQGRIRAQYASLDELKLPSRKRWDGRWHIIISDIPETHKRMRESLRYYTKQAGFFELQKSVWAYPFPCRKEVEFLIRLHRAEPYTHYIVAQAISNNGKLRAHFRV